MFENLQYNAKDFAAAYIQTLPHAKKIEEFNNRADYHDYMKKRRDSFFYQYLESLEFANSFSKSNEEIESSDSWFLVTFSFSIFQTFQVTTTIVMRRVNLYSLFITFPPIHLICKLLLHCRWKLRLMLWWVMSFEFLLLFDCW